MRRTGIRPVVADLDIVEDANCAPGAALSATKARRIDENLAHSFPTSPSRNIPSRLQI
jgi:hypothetical protein